MVIGDVDGKRVLGFWHLGCPECYSHGHWCCGWEESPRVPAPGMPRMPFPWSLARWMGRESWGSGTWDAQIYVWQSLVTCMLLFSAASLVLAPVPAPIPSSPPALLLLLLLTLPPLKAPAQKQSYPCNCSVSFFNHPQEPTLGIH